MRNAMQVAYKNVCTVYTICCLFIPECLKCFKYGRLQEKKTCKSQLDIRSALFRGNTVKRKRAETVTEIIPVVNSAVST